MTRPSYNKLNTKFSQARMVIEALSTDDDYKITTKAAIEFKLRDLAKQGEVPREAILITIDNLKELRKKHSPDIVNGKIRRVIRSPNQKNVLLRARWSTNQLLVLLTHGEAEYIDRIRPILKNEGIDARISATRFTRYVESDVRTLEVIAQAHLEGYEV